MTTISNARIVDVDDGSVREGAVTIEGTKIAAKGVSAGGSEPVIDVDGAYLLPGLISCHTHLSIVFPFHETDESESPAITAIRCQKRALDALEAGVTTVRTVGEMHRADISLRTMIERGWARGPRILSAGRSISVTGGHGSGFGALIADGADAFRRAAREELASGANHLKIFITGGIAHREEGFGEPQMSMEEMEAVVSVARSKDTYVCAHAGGTGPIQKAVVAGVSCFEHGYVLDDETVASMKKTDCYLVPTLSVTRSPEWMRANEFAEWTIDKALSAGPKHLESIRLAIDAGVTIVHGTDMPPGDDNDGVRAASRELEHMVGAGLSPLGSLQSATVNAARMIGLSDTIGRIDVGFEADLVAVRENPVDDIRAMRDIVLVMKAGDVVRSP